MERPEITRKRTIAGRPVAELSKLTQKHSTAVPSIAPAAWNAASMP